MPDYNSDDNINVSYVDYPDSSFVRLVAYDDNSGELYVQLNDNVYVYKDVLEDVYHSFVEAPSVGHFYDVSVKGVYKSGYVGEKDDYGFAVRPVAPAPEPVTEKTSYTVTDHEMDKDWFAVSYTVTTVNSDKVIARSLEEALEILKETLADEGVQDYTVTSIARV
jgi:hypothetical protein